MNLALLESEYISFSTEEPARPFLGEADLGGNELNQAPSYSASLSAQYAIPLRWGDLTLRGEAHLVDDVFFSPFNRPETSQPGYEKYNLFATFEPADGNWQVSAFVRNLTDEITKSSAEVGSALAQFPISGSYDPPRTFGAELSYRF